MNFERENKVLNILKETMDLTPEIQALALVSPDGLPIESLLPPGMEEDRVAAMGAALLSLGEKAAQELEKGGLEQVIVRAEKGDAVLVSVGEDAVLLALMRKEAKLGLVFLVLKRLVARLREVL